MSLGHSLATSIVILAIFSTPLASAQEFRLSLEEPVNGATATGVSNVRGWAVASAGIDRIELAINGEYVFDIPYGGERLDVGGTFPDITDSDQSGYGLTFNYGDLGAGEHTMTVTAIAFDGSELEQTSTFRVIAFPASFLSDAQKPSLADVEIEVDADDGIIELNGVKQGDDDYEVELAWSTASQSFQIVGLDREVLPSACEGELPSSNIPAGITFSKGFTRNVSVVDGVIQSGSEFNFSLVNASSSSITVEEVKIEDEIVTLSTTAGSDVSSLSNGTLGARQALDLTFAVPSSGAEDEIEVEFALSIVGQCFVRDYELFDTSDDVIPEGYTTAASGLQYVAIQDGNGSRPAGNDTVRVHYVGTLEDGSVFDSSYARGEPAVFRADQLIAGFTEGLLLMNEGATYKLRIPPELGYGSQALSGIPANSTLLFELTLIEIL
jgi:hypothetical protein